MTHGIAGILLRAEGEQSYRRCIPFAILHRPCRSAPQHHKADFKTVCRIRNDADTGIGAFLRRRLK